MSQSKKRIAVLGATGTVGQRILSLLDNHELFEVTSVVASSRSVGKRYDAAANWQIDCPMPPWLSHMVVEEAAPNVTCDFVLSALDASVAGEIESAFAKAGIPVISNARNHRMEDDVPLLIPEVNPDQLELITVQKNARNQKGFIVTNPNCSTIGLAVAIKPLVEKFGLEKLSVVTMQALSGAGYPGVPSTDILDNVIPFIGGEEEKMETELKKILGFDFPMSASCNRVPVRDGHLECVSMTFKTHADESAIIDAWNNFEATTYHKEENRPQPLRDKNLGDGMTVSIGRLRPCPIFGWKFVVLSHNTIRGAAGAAIANAELLYSKNLL